jgi:hypothetical protein
LDLLSETAPLPEKEGPHQSCGTATTTIPAPVKPSVRPRAALKSWGVYVNDFIGMVQVNHKHRRHVKIVLIHALDRVFCKLDKEDGPHHQEPASVKKMKKGDAAWATRKIILGWTVDTLAMTVELPPHRVDRIFELLDSVNPLQRRIVTNKWQKIVGELRSMVLAIPGGGGLFSVLQEVLKHRCDNGTRVRLTLGVHSVLQDFRGLASHLARRPTRIAELVPASLPATLGAQDAAGSGMGGVHSVPLPSGEVQPLLLRSPFSREVQARLVTFSNPSSTITNNDLELAASVAQHDVLAHQADVREATIHNSSENVATVWWQRKGATSATGPAARLLRLQALHQRHHRYVPTFDYIPGPANAMADDCSRLWNLTDSQLLVHFNLVYPQNRPWRLCQLQNPMRCALTLALMTKGYDQELTTNGQKPWTTIGPAGTHSAWSTILSRTSETGRTMCPLSKSLVNATETVDWPPSRTPSRLAQWRTPYGQLARHTPDWGPLT